MSLTVCVLASGSSGNCVYLASESTKILIDAGISCKETENRLKAIGIDLAGISAVCVTHEHSDHKDALGVLHRKYGTAVYANHGTVEALARDVKVNGVPWNVFTTGQSFCVGDLVLEPFSVPHDSYDPVGFIVRCGELRAGVVTDMGMVTGLIRERLKGCQIIVVESNHDDEMLKSSARPWSLKQRIAGRQGHLSNSQAGILLTEVASPELKYVFLAHLSGDCNKPDLALKEAKAALECCGQGNVDVKLTYQSRSSDLVTV